MKRKKIEWVVNVGNIGNIACESAVEAVQTYREYVSQSMSEVGRAGGEDVYIFMDDEPIVEFYGSISTREAALEQGELV